MSDTASRVIGIEMVPSAVEDARKNAALNNLQNCEFVCGKAEDALRAGGINQFLQSGEERIAAIVYDAFLFLSSILFVRKFFLPWSEEWQKAKKAGVGGREYDRF